MFSSTLPENSAGSCGTMPIACRSSASRRARLSTPSSVIRPAVTSQNRGSRFASVVFPAPDGPTSATTSPGAMASDTSSRASGSAGW